MRLRWLLIATVTALLSPSLASARRPVVDPRPVIVDAMQPAPAYSIGAAFTPGIHAGRLVLAFYNTDAERPLALPVRVVAETIQYDWLTVELANEWTSKTLTFVADREKSVMQSVRIEPHAFHYETIDLEPLTTDLPPGEYTARITWDGHVTTTNTFVPYRCGLVAPPPPVPTSPQSKLPYLLGGLVLAALVVARRFTKRAGADEVRVPCSVP